MLLLSSGRDKNGGQGFRQMAGGASILPSLAVTPRALAMERCWGQLVLSGTLRACHNYMALAVGYHLENLALCTDSTSSRLFGGHCHVGHICHSGAWSALVPLHSHIWPSVRDSISSMLLCDVITVVTPRQSCLSCARSTLVLLAIMPLALVPSALLPLSGQVHSSAIGNHAFLVLGPLPCPQLSCLQHSCLWLCAYDCASYGDDVISSSLAPLHLVHSCAFSTHAFGKIIIMPSV